MVDFNKFVSEKHIYENCICLYICLLFYTCIKWR